MIVINKPIKLHTPAQSTTKTLSVEESTAKRPLRHICALCINLPNISVSLLPSRTTILPIKSYPNQYLSPSHMRWISSAQNLHRKQHYLLKNNGIMRPIVYLGMYKSSGNKPTLFRSMWQFWRKVIDICRLSSQDKKYSAVAGIEMIYLNWEIGWRRWIFQEFAMTSY